MAIELHHLNTHGMMEQAGNVLDGVVRLKERIAELEKLNHELEEERRWRKFPDEKPKKGQKVLFRAKYKSDNIRTWIGEFRHVYGEVFYANLNMIRYYPQWSFFGWHYYWVEDGYCHLAKVSFDTLEKAKNYLSQTLEKLNYPKAVVVFKKEAK